MNSRHCRACAKLKWDNPQPLRDREKSLPQSGVFVLASLLYALLIITHRSFRVALYEIAARGVNERIGYPGVRVRQVFLRGTLLANLASPPPPSHAPPSFRWHFPDGRVRVIPSLSHSKISRYFVKFASVFQSLVTKIFSIKNIENLREIVDTLKIFCQKF